MRGSAKKKVTGGKLISIRVEFNGSIDKIEIMGDFFLHPEESISYIEESILNTRTDEPEAALAQRISNVAESKKIEMIGVTPEAIASTVKMAIRNGMESNRA